MADDIYTDVIMTSKGMDEEQVEMMVEIYESTDCVKYHDFRTETNTNQQLQHAGSDSARIRNYTAAIVCLLVLCVLLLTAVIVLSVYFYMNSTDYVTKINNITEERDELIRREANLLSERDQLVYFLTILDGWTYYKHSFYFMSNETKNWRDSRRDCTNRKADLVIINNKEEQEFVMNITRNQEFFIGLEDNDVEGRWKWVDGTNATSEFWASYKNIQEPNGGRKENCVVTHLKKEPELIGWIDVPCKDPYQWICEKSLPSHIGKVYKTDN